MSLPVDLSGSCSKLLTVYNNKSQRKQMWKENSIVEEKPMHYESRYCWGITMGSLIIHLSQWFLTGVGDGWCQTTLSNELCIRYLACKIVTLWFIRVTILKFWSSNKMISWLGVTTTWVKVWKDHSIRKVKSHWPKLCFFSFQNEDKLLIHYFVIFCHMMTYSVIEKIVLLLNSHHIPMEKKWEKSYLDSSQQMLSI